MDFGKLKISKNLLNGLKASNYHELTKIQELAINPALEGKDVIVAAKTGSGKTLCFLIPMLELLYKEKTSRHDGLVGLILTPTRELALQIFNVLRKIGKKFEFSAGLLIGGNNIKHEQGNIGFMNILICTPGRLLQHLDQTPLFSADNLKCLIIDECDRVLDMGFKKQLEAIIEHLPPTEYSPRKTFLYSATINKSVIEIASNYMSNPTTIKLYEQDILTPVQLNQRYMITDADKKLDVLWSYIKTHLNSKSMIFLTTCKQVRYIYESFRQLRPGVSLMHIHGAMKQNRRMENYSQFMHSKKAVLFCTDVASRGLDFTGVDWILQVDCPEDVDQYIHRVGRSARHMKGGNTLLLLTPNENEFINMLNNKDIPIKEIKMNKEKQLSIAEKLAGVLVQHKDLKSLAYSYFVSYASAIYKSNDKEVFQFDKYPWEAIAMHLGLHAMPIIQFKKRKPKMEFQAFTDDIDVNLSNEHCKIIEEATGRKINKEVSKIRLEEKNDFLTLKTNDNTEEEPETVYISRNIDRVKQMSKRQIGIAKQKEIKSRGTAKRVVFDEDGNMIDPVSFSKLEDLKNVDEMINKNITSKVLEMKEIDVNDKLEQKRKRKELKLVAREKKRKMNEKSDEEEEKNNMEEVDEPLRNKFELDRLTIEQQEQMALKLLEC
eukprot:NODE_202_length_14999_cov_0.270067.p1 type:complete len:660 gc:universal NODE_202_length_14999_cov_0.270067:236-2215(+)